MKIFLSIICSLLLLLIPASLLSRDYTTGTSSPSTNFFFDDTGIILSSADFWIGIPDEQNAMPFLKIPEGTKVKILDLEKEFYKIEHRNMLGYVKKHLVKIVESESVIVREEPETTTPEPETAPVRQVKKSETKYYPPVGAPQYSVTRATSLRTEPNSQAKVILRFEPGDQVQVLESTGKYWWKVKFRGETGWAKSALLKKK